MSLQFGVGTLTVSGVAIARLNNVSINITYDTAQLRGGNRIFADNMQLYNGAIEGSFENGDINITAVAAMLGASMSAAAGSGTMTLTATQVLATGAAIICNTVTDGVTSTFTIKNCKFNTLGITMDRENYTMPTVNFIAVGDGSGDLLTWQI